MFEATYLAHHCWLFTGERAKILVDPLLTPTWGFTEAIGLTTYPPRRLAVEEMPAIDAVVITHEHEGHFEIASLQMIDRRVPIYLSSRSSDATRSFLAEMGFEVRPLVAGVPIHVGDLGFLPMTADQWSQGKADEWDTLPYLVWDEAKDGSFFSQVDMPVNDSMWQAAQQIVERPGIWQYTNNDNRWELLHSWGYPDDRPLQGFTRALLAQHRTISEGWNAPAAVVISGGGFTMGADQAWLNRTIFALRSEDIVDVLSTLVPKEQFLHPIPGQTIVMEEGLVARVEERTDWLAAAPRSEWPERAFGEVDWLEDYTPATGKRDLDAAELASLEEELRGFAKHLYGTALFRRLYSVDATIAGGKKPTMALMLRAGGGQAYVYEYEPQGCRFRPVACEDPVGEYLAVLECWASDLLAMLRSEVSANTLVFARCRHYCSNPEQFAFDVIRHLLEYCHPLRQGERFGELYRAILARLATSDPSPRVRWAGEKPASLREAV